MSFGLLNIILLYLSLIIELKIMDDSQIILLNVFTTLNIIYYAALNGKNNISLR